MKNAFVIERLIIAMLLQVCQNKKHWWIFRKRKKYEQKKEIDIVYSECRMLFGIGFVLHNPYRKKREFMLKHWDRGFQKLVQYSADWLSDR